MLGPTDSVFEYKSLNHGLIPRIINSIFDENKNREFIIGPEDDKDNYQNLKFDIKSSCLEFYQEQIIDLLSQNNNNFSLNNSSESLLIREDPKRGMYIEGIREESITSQRSAMELIMLGLKNRHQAATNMNAESSRSHLIFTIFLNYSFTNKEGLITSRSSRIHLIDLAGSERQKATMATGERIKEAGMINKSLSLLGNVINALVELSEGKTKYVPFRDSKLTFFLKDSLGGNSKVINFSINYLFYNTLLNKS
jgi:kinesin family protein 15